LSLKAVIAKIFLPRSLHNFKKNITLNSDFMSVYLLVDPFLSYVYAGLKSDKDNNKIKTA
jgi:hypothetical protein